MGDAKRRSDLVKMMNFTANGFIQTNPLFQIPERPSNSKVERYAFSCRNKKNQTKFFD
jgi:hypothetical protein